MKKLFALFALLLGYALGASAQQTVTGTVVDARNGKPVAGANVSIEHSLRGVTTDAGGRFSLE